MHLARIGCLTTAAYHRMQQYPWTIFMPRIVWNIDICECFKWRTINNQQSIKNTAHGGCGRDCNCCRIVRQHLYCSQGCQPMQHLPLAGSEYQRVPLAAAASKTFWRCLRLRHASIKGKGVTRLQLQPPAHPFIRPKPLSRRLPPVLRAGELLQGPARAQGRSRLKNDRLLACTVER